MSDQTTVREVSPDIRRTAIEIVDIVIGHTPSASDNPYSHVAAYDVVEVKLRALLAEQGSWADAERACWRETSERAASVAGARTAAIIASAFEAVAQKCREIANGQ